MHDDHIYINGKPATDAQLRKLTGFDKDKDTQHQSSVKSWGGFLATLNDADLQLEGQRVSYRHVDGGGE